ncbi:hypothetical protein OsI_31124 [Oryza sativa Indica Group]|uniref:Uncharacterized protein n=1 Tax=Oryza sativa subsp. indica TaxID=39946 RepID=A2Z0K1_ORYSI|nr:hypothetical protein OsI_31124 [Oryza sativa Indica Group]
MANKMKIREYTKAKEENLALAEQEHAKRESAKANAERRLEEIRQKTEVESRCFKDDIKRLEDELARLQKSMGVNHPTVPSTHPPGVADRNSTRGAKAAHQPKAIARVEQAVASAYPEGKPSQGLRDLQEGGGVRDPASVRPPGALRRLQQEA